MNTYRRYTPSTLFAVLALVLAVAAASPVAAQGPGMAPRMGNGMGQGMGQGMHQGPANRLDRLADRLDLSEEQVAAIRDLQEKNRQESVELRKELKRLQNDLKGEMLKDDPSEKTVLSLNQKMGEIRTQLKAGRLKTRLGVREQLTPEQRDKMLLMGEGRHERGSRFGTGSGRDFPGRAPRAGRMHGRHDGSGPRSRMEQVSPEDDDK